MDRRMMQQIQQMQKKMMQAQEELGNETVEVSAAGGAITIVISGHQIVQSIKIDPDVVDPEDVPMLEDMMLTAINEAIDQSQEMAKKKMAPFTGGLNLPGM